MLSYLDYLDSNYEWYVYATAHYITLTLSFLRRLVIRYPCWYAEIWQCPTVLVPLEIDGQGRELCRR